MNFDAVNGTRIAMTLAFSVFIASFAVQADTARAFDGALEQCQEVCVISHTGCLLDPILAATCYQNMSSCISSCSVGCKGCHPGGVSFRGIPEGVRPLLQKALCKSREGAAAFDLAALMADLSDKNIKPLCESGMNSFHPLEYLEVKEIYN